MIAQVWYSLGLFLGSLALGWWLRRRGILTDARAGRLVRLIVMGLSPIVSCLTVWQMDLRSAQPWLIPFMGLAVSLATLLPALVYARRAHLSGPQVGSFLTCAFFSNVGYFGAFTAFALFGETAYGFCVLYYLLFTPSFYTIGFGIAAHYGRQQGPAGPRPIAGDELRLYPVAGLAAGAVLSLLGIPRPAWGEALNHLLIPIDTALYLVAIGSQLSLAWPGRWMRPCLVMSGIKFLYAPLVALALIHLFGITGLARPIILLEASTPVAVSALVLPLLFGLDRQLANALWLVTTVLAVPWFLILIPLLR